MATRLVISICGGGIRGVIPACILSYLEERIGRPLYQVADLIAGTSTGGIIAIGLGLGIPARKMQDLYIKRGAEIFPHKVRARLLESKYSGAGLQSVLDSTFGASRYPDCKTKVMATSFDCFENCPRLLRSWEYIGSCYSCTEIARMTSAAPTYLPPINKRWIDGGVFANNPSVQAYAEAVKLWPHDEIKVLSIGTGQPANRHGKLVTHSGMLQWMFKITEIALDSPADDVHVTMQSLLGDNYLYMEPTLGRTVNPAMDDARPENIEQLCNSARKLLVDEEQELERFVRSAIASSPNTKGVPIPHGTT